jgi:hypothetical protein
VEEIYHRVYWLGIIENEHKMRRNFKFRTLGRSFIVINNVTAENLRM